MCEAILQTQARPHPRVMLYADYIVTSTAVSCSRCYCVCGLSALQPFNLGPGDLACKRYLHIRTAALSHSRPHGADELRQQVPHRSHDRGGVGPGGGGPGVGVPHRGHPGAGGVDHRWVGVHLHLGLPGLRVQARLPPHARSCLGLW